MNVFWKINRWYDDLDKDYPHRRFAYFMTVFMAILLMPSISLLITGEDYPIVTVIMWAMLFLIGIIRIIWLRKNGAL